MSLWNSHNDVITIKYIVTVFFSECLRNKICITLKGNSAGDGKLRGNTIFFYTIWFIRNKLLVQIKRGLECLLNGACYTAGILTNGTPQKRFYCVGMPLEGSMFAPSFMLSGSRSVSKQPRPF